MRYFERVLGFDIDEIRDKIFPPGLQAAANMGARSVPVADETGRVTHVVKIRNKTVVTVVSKNE